ncbi:hypothetical protein [Ulvibacterium sp.]|uniref:SPW repeat domain-containing protein n=1 Tax=Ulvibacterium sp. TaxID=2665914 RepID=UPI002634BB6D|nr:hypothetical protein [Ulvibacterium sp.]
MGFVTKKMHAYLDYPVAVALIVLPFVLGLGGSNPLAWQLSVITGIAAFVLTILTDHQLGLYRIVSYKGHLIVDALVGIVFIVAPFVFSFEGLDAYFYWINGAAVLAVVSLHKPEMAIHT